MCFVKTGDSGEGERGKTQQSAVLTSWATELADAHSSAQRKPSLAQKRGDERSGRKLSIFCGWPKRLKSANP